MAAFRVRVPAWANFSFTYSFSINHRTKNKNTGICFQTDKQEEIFNNFEIRNYFIFQLITIVVLLIGVMDFCRN